MGRMIRNWFCFWLVALLLVGCDAGQGTDADSDPEQAFVATEDAYEVVSDGMEDETEDNGDTEVKADSEEQKTASSDSNKESSSEPHRQAWDGSEIQDTEHVAADHTEKGKNYHDVSDIPEYSGMPYVELNGNKPLFTDDDRTTEGFEEYSELDDLGRCGTAYANICKEIMPEEKRGKIGSVRPSGWHTKNYHDLVEGNYLYNRCHLIAHKLAGENANERNLITGTRYLNTKGMLPFEDRVSEYVGSTGNHVLYRVTPIFKEDDLVASGVMMEAESVEDNGQGVQFCVYCYNVQPGITIRYLDGESWVADDEKLALDGESWEDAESQASDERASENDEESAADSSQGEEKKKESSRDKVEGESEPEAIAKGTQLQEDVAEITYILNKNTKKFHHPECSSVDDMKESNKIYSKDSRDQIIERGYAPCQRCNP